MISITVNSSQVTALLQRLSVCCRDASPVMQAMGSELLKITERNFQKLGSAYRPTAWPNKADGSPSNLKKTGRLAQSFKLTFGPDFAMVSTDAPYAAIHQFGGQTAPHKIEPRRKKALAFGGIIVKSVNHPGSRIPPRPFLPITSSSGGLTDAAAGLIIRAGESALSRILA